MMKYYKIFYSQYSQRTQAQHKFVSEILSKMPCAFDCSGLNSDFVSLYENWIIRGLVDRSWQTDWGGVCGFFSENGKTNAAFTPSEQAHVVLKARS